MTEFFSLKNAEFYTRKSREKETFLARPKYSEDLQDQGKKFEAKGKIPNISAPETLKNGNKVYSKQAFHIVQSQEKLH